MRERRRWGRAASALALLLTACGGEEPKRPETPASCYADLAGRGATFARLGPTGSGACAVPAPVRLYAGAARLDPPAVLSCPMARAWLDFEREDLGPLALDAFGRKVVTVRDFGGHACRRMTGNGRRMSLHATGEALDVGSLELEDGTTIDVEEDWYGGVPLWRTREAGLLRDLAAAACERFGVVLTPDNDDAHSDHIHLDVGPWRLCDD